MKFEIPSQLVNTDTPTGIEPRWYTWFKTLADFVKNGAYSEGSYTPVLSAPGGTIPTFVTTPLVGRYVKVGRLCTVRIAGANTAGGTPGSGAFQLSVSLPLTVFASGIKGRVMAGAWANAGQEGVAFAEGTAGSGVAALYNLGSTSNQVPLNCNDLNNVSRSLSLVISYFTD